MSRRVLARRHILLLFAFLFMSAGRRSDGLVLAMFVVIGLVIAMAALRVVLIGLIVSDVLAVVALLVVLCLVRLIGARTSLRISVLCSCGVRKSTR